MQRRPTIIDVAREAGVSKSTVSLVLQNSPLVRDETRTHVRETMAKIGYVYNRSAANLRASNAGLIGLVINDLRNPFFTEFATSLQMELSSRGYTAVVANTDEKPELQAQVVAAMIEHGVSAFIISPTYGEEDATFDAIRRARIPAMQVLRRAHPDIDTFPFAAPRYPDGSRMAVEHLLAIGAKHIAFVGGLEGMQVTRERMSGYLEGLKKAGMKPLVFTGRTTRAFGREAARLLTAEHPEVDAAICFNDLVALGMLSGFARMGRSVGRDFKIVGFDDIEDASEVYPGLTTVRCNIAGFGEQMAQLVIDWLEDGKAPPRELLTPVDLVVRESSTREN